MFDLLVKEEISFINQRPVRQHPLVYDYGYIGGLRRAQKLAAQHRLHLTAFGVGMLAFCVIYFVLLFELLRKYGGK